jgi:1,2-dihydroxy-3-keto-5-methylthiopentene dioxygenase
MAIVSIPDQQRTASPDEARALLAAAGIDHERWTPAHPLAGEASAEHVLAAYAPEIDRLKQQGGYVTADVIDVSPATPNLEAMLAKFRREHWHDEDEVRFIIEGRGVFFVRAMKAHGGSVAAEPISIEVGPGDLLRVPRGTHHWFDLCSDRRIRAIRLFQDPSGWTPHYTDSGVDASYQPLCLGPSQLPAGR